MRQIDNHIINPFGLDDLLESVADYVQNYRSSGFIFDNSIYEEFDLTSTTSESGVNDDDENDDEKEDENENEKERGSASDEKGVSIHSFDRMISHVR